MSPALNETDQLLERFDLGTLHVLDDAREDRLRYSLLRLTLCGLTHEEVSELSQIGRLVLTGGDAQDAAERVRQNPAASPLARALALIVQRSAGDPIDARLALLGAVLGAHLGTLANDEAARPSLAITGAMAGAAAGPSVPLALAASDRVGAETYTRAQD